MPRIPGTNNRQTIFLRAFHTHPAGPPPADWPSPAILRRWLRKPAFKRALASVQDTLRFQADFHLSSAANKALQTLSTQDQAITPQDVSRLLRLSHVRQRFATTPEADASPDPTSDDTTATATATPDAAQDQDKDDDIPEYDERGNWINPYRRGQLRVQKRALRYGFMPPLELHPEFPAPEPQDTFYYHLVHNPESLLWFMKIYTQRFPHDTRFQHILDNCDEYVPLIGGLPQFAKTDAAIPAPAPPV